MVGRSLTARPDLAAQLRDVLDKARDSTPNEVIADLRAHDTAAFGILAEIVSGAYFMNPDVRRAIGYTGQGPRQSTPVPIIWKRGCWIGDSPGANLSAYAGSLTSVMRGNAL